MVFSPEIPIYIQIANDIKQKIIAGEIQENQKLLSIREYCQLYEVTSITMQRAIAKLESEGITTAQKGVGSFVNDGVVKKITEVEVKNCVSLFIERMRKMNFNDTQIIKRVQGELRDGNNS